MENIKLDAPTIVSPEPLAKSITDLKAVAPPRTTAEEDRHTTGQRRTNLLWEITQASMALSIAAAVIWTALFKPEIPKTLSDFFFVIIGFYFGRTNHQRVGGVDLGR